MRRFFFAFCCCFVSLLSAQSLADFDASGDVTEFSDALGDFMNDTGNKTAKDAYANFSGVYFGGGFSEEQQRRIAATSVKLAQRRIAASSGFTPYLDLLANLTGADGLENPLFNEFHDSLDEFLKSSKARSSSIIRSLEGANRFFRHRKLGQNDDLTTGWFALGGAPHFEFADALVMRLDTVRELRAMGKQDTLKITETALRYNLTDGSVTGKGGRTDWQRHGLAPEIFSLLVSYKFDVKRLLYTADSAHFQYPEYFGDEILVGAFRDKVMPGGARADAEYPQFVSDDGFVEIENVGEGINLFGNFELRGSTVFAIGIKGRKAQVNLTIDDEEGEAKVRGKASRFTVRQKERIGGQGVETTIYTGEDSLYHPSVTMQVNIPERKVALTRTASSSDQSPFNHSLNNLNIYADKIDIYLDQDSAVVGTKTVSFQEKTDVIFESKDLYSAREYNFVRATGSINPLDIIYAFRNGPDGGNDLIDANELARKFNPRFTVENIRPLLFDLQSRGFLLYDSETEEVLLLDKVAHFVESSREEKDYDQLRLVSKTKEINAVMDLSTGVIRMDAVQPIEFNRKKQIALKPLGSQVSINGDRDFDFSGDVFAGGMILSGKDFHFKYAPYYVQLDSVRYVDLFLPVDDFIGDGMKRESTG
ncbi:MAG: hypothetical protein AAFN92_09475, partial [Bacteroidota bacterium]